MDLERTWHAIFGFELMSCFFESAPVTFFVDIAAASWNDGPLNHDSEVHKHLCYSPRDKSTIFDVWIAVGQTSTADIRSSYEDQLHVWCSQQPSGGAPRRASRDGPHSHTEVFLVVTMVLRRKVRQPVPHGFDYTKILCVDAFCHIKAFPLSTSKGVIIRLGPAVLR